MATKTHKTLKEFSTGILCFFVALSFFATLVPLTEASNDAMPCCVGKAAGHCDSGITPKKIPLPKSEPMCGLDSSEPEDDGITIVAEPFHNESHHSLSQTSVSKPCQMECGACASASSRQQKRERAIAESRGRHTSPSISVSRFEDLPLVFTSNENWPRIIPRGPPRYVIL